MRIAILLSLLILAACSNGSQKSGGGGDNAIACALGGAKEFTKDCTVERVQQDGKLTLIVHHPDGGFRRFEVLTDGRGLAAADGADEVQSKLDGAVLEVAVGTDVYRFPATRKPVTQGNASAK